MIKRFWLASRASPLRRALSRTALLTGAGYGIGIWRDAALTSTLGGTRSLDIFFAALAPALLWGTEMANLAYLSVLPQLVRSRSSQMLARTRSLLILTAAGGMITLAAIGLFFPKLIAPGFSEPAEQRALALSMGAMALLIPMLTLAGLVRARHETMGHFAFWATFSASRSLGVITVVFLLSRTDSPLLPTGGMLLGVAIWLAVGMRRLPNLRPQVGAPASNQTPTVQLLLGPLFISMVIAQVTGFADVNAASRLGVGGVQIYTLAVNLLVVPQGLVGGVIASVFYPRFAQYASVSDHVASSRSLRQASILTVVGLLPAVAAFVSPFGLRIAEFLYRLPPELLKATADCAAAVAIGQIGFALLFLGRQFLVAHNRPWAVVTSVLLFMVLKLVGNELLAPRLGLPGLALASSLASVVALAALVHPLRRATRGAESARAV